MSTLIFKDLGATGYRAALAIQESLVERKEDLPDILLFVEHPHVITIGRGGKESNIVDPGEVPVYRTSRGGGWSGRLPGAGNRAWRAAFGLPAHRFRAANCARTR